MKTLLLIFLFLSNQLLAQSFEGTLIYTSEIEVTLTEQMKELGLTEEMILEKAAEKGYQRDSIMITYKDGNYRIDIGNEEKSWAIYKQETNKLYAFQDGEASELCAVTDASVDAEAQLTGKMPDVIKLDSTANVGGIVCNIVRIVWGAGSYDYYYNSDQLKINPDLFALHKYDGWSEFLVISHALPMKIIKRVGKFGVLTMTLKKAIPGKVDAVIFSVPELTSDSQLNVVPLPGVEIMRIKK